MPCQSSHPDCTSYKIVFLASADSSTSLTHTHTHRHLSHLCAHFCGTRGTVWQLTPFFGKVQTLLSFRFWLNSFTLSLCFIVCLSAAQNGCMKATYTSISSEAAFRWKHDQLKQDTGWSACLTNQLSTAGIPCTQQRTINIDFSTKVCYENLHNIYHNKLDHYLAALQLKYPCKAFNSISPAYNLIL